MHGCDLSCRKNGIASLVLKVKLEIRFHIFFFWLGFLGNPSLVKSRFFSVLASVTPTIIYMAIVGIYSGKYTFNWQIKLRVGVISVAKKIELLHLS